MSPYMAYSCWLCTHYWLEGKVNLSSNSQETGKGNWKADVAM